MIRPRRGYTLMETIVAMTLLSVTWTTISVTLHAMYRADQRLRDEMARETTLFQLGNRLRTDAHAARAGTVVEVAGDEPRLLLAMLATTTIHYRWHDAEVIREVHQEEQIVHRDSYLLPHATIAWRLIDTGGSSVVLLTARVADTRRHTEATFEIKAALGLASVPAEVSESIEENQP